MTPDSGSLVPVRFITDRTRTIGGTAIPVYLYTTPPANSRVLGNLPKRAIRIQASDLRQNGGQYELDQRVYAMPIIEDNRTPVENNDAIPVYVVNP